MLSSVGDGYPETLDNIFVKLKHKFYLKLKTKIEMVLIILLIPFRYGFDLSVYNNIKILVNIFQTSSKK